MGGVDLLCLSGGLNNMIYAIENGDYIQSIFPAYGG